MNNYDDYHKYLREHVMVPFYLKRLNALQEMALSDVLSRKNPYLFKAKNIELAGDLAKGVVDAFLSSREETLFGDLMEGFAIYVAHQLHGGFKSKRKSLDLEFKRGGQYFIVGIKSGVNWGNSDQVNTMKSNFKVARQELRASGVKCKIVAVNGCIYGRDSSPEKKNADADKHYFKYAGQEFWKFLSGDDELYRQIIAPIDQEARQKDEAFRAAYIAKVNELTLDFSLNFVTQGQIDWLKLIHYVSAREKTTLQRAVPAEEAAVEQIKSSMQKVKAPRVKPSR